MLVRECTAPMFALQQRSSPSPGVQRCCQQTEQASGVTVNLNSTKTESEVASLPLLPPPPPLQGRCVHSAVARLCSEQHASPLTQALRRFAARLRARPATREWRGGRPAGRQAQAHCVAAPVAFASPSLRRPRRGTTISRRRASGPNGVLSLQQLPSRLTRPAALRRENKGIALIYAVPRSATSNAVFRHCFLLSDSKYDSTKPICSIWIASLKNDDL